MRRTLSWLGVCALSDIVPAVASRGFATPGGWLAPPTIGLLIAVPIATFVVGWWICLMGDNRHLLPGWVARLDWRVAAIWIATGLSAALTLFGWFLNLPDAHDRFVRDVFAGWVGSVVFFGQVGIVVSLVSLANAAKDRFDARVRVLVRGKSGTHVDDFIDRLRSGLAHYAASVTRQIAVMDYDETTGMYQVNTVVRTVIRSFVDDIETSYRSGVSYKPDHPPPPGRHHRLLRVSGVQCDDIVPMISMRADLLSCGYVARLVPEGECVVEFILEFWVKAGEECIGYSPVRYSLLTAVEIDNRLHRTLRVRSAWIGDPLRTLVLPAGASPHQEQRRGLKQGTRVHSLFLDPLRPGD